MENFRIKQATTNPNQLSTNKNLGLMKHTIIIFLFSLVIVSCGNKKEQSTEDLIASGNIEAIQQKRDELTNQQQEIHDKLKLLDDKLKELNPEKNVPLITSFVAQSEPFEHFLELQGNVETKQNLVINAEMSGILDHVYVKQGDNVKKGQLLASVDDGGMSQQLAQMQIQADLAKTTYERQKRLWDQKIGSEIQYLQAKSTYEANQKAVAQMRSQLGKSSIRAPFNGTIDDIITEQGSVVSPGQTPIMRIVNLSDMYITTDVPENYVGNVTKGKNVEVTFPVLNKTIESKVRQTGDFINPNNRTFTAEIDIPNKENNIKPNLTARLRINDYSKDKAILIPQSIISENAEGKQYIYILQQKEGQKAVAKQQVIKTGKTQGDVIEVIEGLKDGDEIIEEGARSVKDGQTVKIITY